MNNIKLIILDMDNTIYNYDFANQASVNDIMTYLTNTFDMTHDFLLKAYQNSKKYINNKFSKTAIAHDKSLQLKDFVDKLNITNKISIINNLNEIYHCSFIVLNN